MYYETLLLMKNLKIQKVLLFPYPYHFRNAYVMLIALAAAIPTLPYGMSNSYSKFLLGKKF